jgi:hypothetical protein
MPTIPYSPRGFGKSANASLTRPSSLSASWADIARAAVTVGKPSSFFTKRHSVYVRRELTYRALLIRANLRSGPHGEGIVQTDPFGLLDPSEKGAISYFWGLCFTKLLAERLFGIRELVHLSLYAKPKRIRFRKHSLKRPDLVGLDRHNNWAVFEAKGRSGVVSSKLMTQAKKQAAMVRSISAKAPRWRIALGVGFAKGRLKLDLLDPPQANRRAFDLDLRPEDVQEKYYFPLRTLLESTSGTMGYRVDEELYVCTRLRAAGLTIGLRADLLRTRPEVGSSDTALDPSATSETSVGLDGVFCAVDRNWSPEYPRT